MLVALYVNIFNLKVFFFSALLISQLQFDPISRIDNRLRRYNEHFICDCYPLCDFNMYPIAMDSGNLGRKYSLTDKRFL